LKAGGATSKKRPSSVTTTPEKSYGGERAQRTAHYVVRQHRIVEHQHGRLTPGRANGPTGLLITGPPLAEGAVGLRERKNGNLGAVQFIRIHARGGVPASFRAVFKPAEKKK